eukprot:TRINITY_DN11091_c0_g1_i1.p1 TRINITY_DN11091_c0_g1~~TRINITY_DN11091_c0_g1_i1.p1  ORF type:complete len:396 (-),score=44.99 TRINITY_DN11091_c0_g1_i1:69-1256(-)
MAQKASAEQRTLLLTTGAALLASTTVYLAIHRPDLLRRLAFWRKGPQPACVGRVSHLFVFPLKSGAAIQVQECPVDVSGFHYDREWMIVTQAPEGEMAKMLTIREYPHMARIQPSFDGGGDEMRGQFYGNLVLTLPDTNESFIVQEPVQPKSVKCMIWRTQIEASDQGDEVSEFLTKYFRRNEAKVEVPVRLLRMATPTRRLSEDGKYCDLVAGLPGEPNLITKLPDWSPLGLTTLQSLEWVEKEACGSSDMNLLPQRFRANIIVDTRTRALAADTTEDMELHPPSDKPFQEDTWSKFRVGEVACQFLKRTGRCTVPTVDPATGQRNPGGEPLRTIKKLRASVYPHLTDDHPFFVKGHREGFLATNVLHWYKEGQAIRVGDPVVVDHFDELYRPM